jgi:hypothetical protein
VAVGSSKKEVPGEAHPGPQAKVYASEKFGFTMYYPEGYLIEERDMPGGEMRGHHVITLTADTPGNRDLREGKVAGGEGPVAVTVDIVDNNLDQNSAEEWIKNSAGSNYKLSDGTIIPAVINGVEALSYHSTGLYEMDHAVFRHGDYIYMFTVSYADSKDPIRRDFQGIVTSVRFTN